MTWPHSSQIYSSFLLNYIANLDHGFKLQVSELNLLCLVSLNYLYKKKRQDEEEAMSFFLSAN